MKLSKRLHMNVSLVPNGARVADIGCDHGYASIYLIEHGIAQKVIAMDVNEGPIGRAKEHVKQAGLESRIACRKSDGMEKLLPGEVDTLMIAGMGGPLMIRILAEGGHVMEGIRTLVLQPQSEPEKVRRYLLEHGFYPIEEKACMEDGKYYFAIRAERQDAGEQTEWNEEWQYRYGTYLANKGDPVLKCYLLKERAKYEKILQRFRPEPEQDECRGEIRHKMNEIDKCLAQIQAVHGFGGERTGVQMEKIEVMVNGEPVSCESGITLQELSVQYAADKKCRPAIVAKVDGVVKELYHTVSEKCEIRFCTYQNIEGKKAYARGITMIMLKAFYKEVPKDQFEKITVENSLDTGYYCTLSGGAEVTEELLEKVEKRMRKYVEDDVVFEKKSMGVEKAIRLFTEKKMYDKGNLLKYRRSSKVNIYKLGKVMDYFYGPMPYSTGVLQRFRLEKFDKGFVFVIPRSGAPDELPAFVPSMKLHRTITQTAEWGVRLGVENVGQLNDVIVNGGMRELMLVQEALHEKRIGDIAEQIAASGKIKVVTIAGPSSSGKTTFSYRLSAQLKTLGLKPHPIAMDDYFVNRVDTPRGKDGKYNYECLEAIDVRQFNQDMEELLAGEEVQLPTYNFITGEREYNKPVMQLEPDEVLVVEGIHGLNDKLTERVPAEKKFKIYISALTTLNVDEHNRIPTSDGRLLRRIIRDARTRGHEAQTSISMWKSVRSGESENIFPFQEKADAMFNSSLVYEFSALKQYAEPLLFKVPRDSEEYAEAQRLLKFLDYFLGINPEEVPLNSIVREFIGGGILLG